MASVDFVAIKKALEFAQRATDEEWTILTDSFMYGTKMVYRLESHGKQ